MSEQRLVWWLAFVVLVIAPASTTAAPLVEAKQGMVVSVSPEASDVGLAVLQQGGTAVDAAVATALALAVAFPEAGNIGGGGFMMVYPGKGQEPVCIEYRETAPASTHARTFVDETRQFGHHTVGVPGTLRGLALAQTKYGKLKWKELVEPAVELAREGFAIDAALATGLNGLLKSAEEFPELKRAFGKSDGSPWQAGDKLVQPDLAKTLQTLADEGAEAFYTGSIAEQIVAEMKAEKGFITLDDLKQYRPHIRKPIHGTFRGFDIYGPPPPSSGGTVIVEVLNILEQLDLKQPRYSPESMHLIIEATKRAYCDRARYLGDPDFYSITQPLTSKSHAKQWATTIRPDRATPSEELAPELQIKPEGENTTHFSVVDASGMAVSNTYTLQASYGAKVVVRGAGFLLNNEMTDFNWKPEVTDRTGRIGTAPNQVAPGKRMLSSQSPTLVFKHQRLWLVTGSPGGRTIPNTVLSVLLATMHDGEDVRQAVDAPRWHHAWFPDRVNFEGLQAPEHAKLVEELKKRGHQFADRATKQGDAHSIMLGEGKLWGAADGRRTVGKAAGY